MTRSEQAWWAFRVAAAIAFAMYLVATVMAVVFPAAAQSRHDPDQAWIRKTLRDPGVHARSEPEVRYHKPAPKRYYNPPEPHSHVVVQQHSSTRVHAYVARQGGGSTVQDAMGHIECLPPIEARSHERQSEDGAWDDAQRSWSNTVRWKYGERFGGLQNALTIERRCNVSTVSEGVAGKMIEAVRGVVGADDAGRRWRCEMRASPCVAPVNRDPAIKGDNPKP